MSDFLSAAKMSKIVRDPDLLWARVTCSGVGDAWVRASDDNRIIDKTKRTKLLTPSLMFSWGPLERRQKIFYFESQK
jgi:hypothetical protein